VRFAASLLLIVSKPFLAPGMAAVLVSVTIYREAIKMHTHFNCRYLRTFSDLNRNVLYGVQCDISSKGGASHMNASATLSNGMRVAIKDGGTVVVRATQVRTHFLLTHLFNC
jgi:hypothetical protein